MSPSIRTFALDTETADIVAEIRSNGVAIVENVYSTDAIQSLRALAERDLDKQKAGANEIFGDKKRSLTSLFARGGEFSETLLLNERVLELMDAVLLPENPMASSAKPSVPFEGEPTEEMIAAYFAGPDPLIGPNCHHYRVNASVAMQVRKGGENQELHRDQWRYLPFMRRDPEGPELTMAVMAAGSDFTIENGATRYIPGSNHWPDSRAPEDHEVVQSVMSQGSAAFWLGSVLHGFGASSVDEPRTGFIYSFGLDHLAQEENQFLAVPPKIARTLPVKARQLLGYRSSDLINWVEGLDKDDMASEGKSSLFY